MSTGVDGAARAQGGAHGMGQAGYMGMQRRLDAWGDGAMARDGRAHALAALMQLVRD